MLKLLNLKDHPIRPQNFEESLVWYATVLTYPFYFTGTLYFVGPIVGWVLVLRLAYRKYRGEDLPIPVVTWIWVACTFALLVALVGGLLNFDYGLTSIIKAILGWAKGWALFAVLPLAGALPIRPALVYRAVCMLCLHSVLLFPIYWLGYVLRLPTPLYTVPLNFFGAPPGCFEVGFYVIDYDTLAPRIGLFAPWAAASGFIGNALFPLTLQEKNRFWQASGIAGCLLMVYICSGSRAAVVALPLALILTWILSRAAKPYLLIAYGVAATLVGIAWAPVTEALRAYVDRVRGSRPGSTRVRDTLDRIALDRFPDAPIFGHAVPERGPKIVEHMPIGSHNTFTALLFLRGIVGFAAYVIGLAASFLNLWWTSLTMTVAFCGLQVWWILVFNSRYDSAEVTIYLVWQSLVVMGIAYCGKKNDRSGTETKAG